jgi:uncharacterized NAD(P)/FAD-binding protein YdhS
MNSRIDASGADQLRTTRGRVCKLEIAIVGGGASGTLTAMQLLRQAAREPLPLRMTLIDRYGRHGLGQAYATEHRAHLLNTMAGQMSALPDEPDHLLDWAHVSSEAFLPRRSYGRYLLDTLADAERQAPLSARLSRIRSEVVAIRQDQLGGKLRLTLSDGCLDADMAVLALGSPPARLPFPVPPSDRIITDPWSPGALAAITDGSPVVIVGTGLTMMDLATAIAGRSDAAMYAVSRHGMLPRPHPDRALRRRPIWLPTITRTSGPVRLTELMRHVRVAVRADPSSWPDVIHAIRPFVPSLWHRMPDRDRRSFIRHVSRYWEVHRHLVPPATAGQIAALRSSGQLSILQGQIADVSEVGDGLRVRVESSNGRSGAAHTGPDRTELAAGWLMNGTGAPTDIGAATDPLLTDLFASGMARPDSLGLGLNATVQGAIIDASGTASEVLYTLGPPLRGTWYETTAIPEIREQAAALARLIASRSQADRHHPGSAA